MRPVRVILYSSHFRKRFKKLDSSLLEEVSKREVQFRKDSLHPSLGTHKLSGKLKDFWSFSITRKHRILFQFISAHEAYFVDVDDHDMYR